LLSWHFYCLFSWCGAGEGWRRSGRQITWEMKCYTESRGTGISYVQTIKKKDG